MPSNQIKSSRSVDPTWNGPPAPLYERVKSWILQKINSGEWSPGDKILSENDLVRQLGVSRMTVHRGLRELVTEQRLKRVPGVGTFVAEPRIPAPLLELRSISEEIEERGGSHRGVLQLQRREKVTKEIATKLLLPLGSPIYHTTILHFDRDQPVQIEDRYVNPDATPRYIDQDFVNETPSQYLVRTTPFTEAEHLIEAAMPDNRERKLLQLGDNEPVLILYRRTWNGPTLVTAATFVHPASRFRFSGRFRPDRRQG